MRFRLPAAGTPPVGSTRELTFTEMRCGRRRLAAIPPVSPAVYVVENEITYLAFPPVAGAIVIFGGGYAVSALDHSAWLADRRAVTGATSTPTDSPS